MNENKKNKPLQGPEKKKPGKSGFNLIFTLIFVVFMAMIVLTMVKEDSFRDSAEITPIKFKKLLYSCRIMTLDVGYDKVEGRYIKDMTLLEETWNRINSNQDPSTDTNLGAFYLDLGREEFNKLTPDYSLYTKRRLTRGDLEDLKTSIERDKVYVVSYYTLTIEPSSVVRQGDGDPYPEISHEEEGTLLFVNYFQDNRAASFKMFPFSKESTSNLSTILGLMRDKFPDAKSSHITIQDDSSLQYNKPNAFWTTIFAPLIPWILIIGLLWFFIIRQMRVGGGGGNVLSFGKSRATLVNKDKAKITFNDVAGIEEAKEEVNEIIEFLKDPGKFSRLGGRIPSGVLLVGAPGTGKTLLARAIAGEADVPFYSICGSDFVEMFVGVGASRVRDLFTQARENSPCLIFLDEIDAVGRKRGSGLGGGHDEREQTLNAILVEMDGFEKDEGIILVAATNRPDVLDAALLRPGRFDREIMIDLPDLMGREAILKVHCRKVKISATVELSIIARGTPGFSGAELEALVNEAALIATMKDQNAVEMEDMEEARDKVRWGRQKKSRVMEEEDRLVTAYHESGHALVANLLPDAENIHKVTIIPRGAALGATMILPAKDKYHFRRNELLDNIKVLYAGRIAEEKFCGDISGGAKNDIERATEIARTMVCQLGMSDSVGPISYGEQHDHVFLGNELTRSYNFSDEMTRLIDSEVKRFLDECYQAADKIIEGNREKLVTIAETLMEFETIAGKVVEDILAGKTFEDIKESLTIIPEPDVQEEAKDAQPPADPAKNDNREELDAGDLPPAGEPAY